MNFIMILLNKLNGSKKPNKIYSPYKGLLLVVILLYFTSCGTTNRIGLELQGDNLIEGTFFTDSLEVKTSIVLLDSINTSDTRYTLVGRYADEKFGETSAQGFMQLILPTEDSALVFGSDDAVFDSIVFSLPLAEIFGDTNLPVTYEVHELAEQLDTTVYYHSEKIENVKPELLGEKTYDFSQDSLRRLIIRLSDDFGTKIFNESGNSVLQFQDEFEAFINGIRLRPKEGDKGHLLALRPYTTGAVAYLRVYYSEPGDTVSSYKTIGFGRAFHNIENDFSESKYLSGLTKDNPIPTSETNNELYIQEGIGIATKIEFPGLENLITDQLAVVNRAELFFSPPPSTVDDHATPPADLIFLLPNSDGSLNAEDGPSFLFGEASASMLTLTYNFSGRNYTIPRITTYIQGVMNKTIDNNGLILTTPITKESSDVFGNVSAYQEAAIANPESTGKLIIGGPNYEFDKEMKLQLYYTEF
ncbi:DUF4270 family protein [Flammeovirgaceae bacterium SG7u.111]|nr:DUF4270 family protein [Flammeovirgaceae bacterium SG7u.132]WPO37475.1 DUF4270 family protein [Flammeovirgaceae bacterium SG7u.111]